MTLAALMAPPPETAAEDLFAWADAGQRELIAQIKRLVELLAADPGLAPALGQTPGQGRRALAGRGLELDAAQLSPLWRDGFNPWPKAHTPLLALWDRWLRSHAAHRARLRAIAGLPPALAAWRDRQMARCALELGPFANRLDYPVLAFELSKGCSIGCWFCALEAPRLSAVFRRDDRGAKLWRETLAACAEVLGPAALANAPCYWASEPADNPDYPDLLADLAALAGRPGPTTTAAATGDIGWTRALLAIYDGRPGLRFSVLSLEMLAAIHAAFSPLELLLVDCLAQNEASAIPKSRSGRARRGGRWLAVRQAAEARLAGRATDPRRETTACLAGFKLNMAEQTIELLSPCAASDRWPRGYRLHAEGSFATAEDVGRFIKQTAERLTPQSPPPGRVIGLGHGVVLRHNAHDLEFTSAAAKMRLPAEPALARVAGLAAQGKWDAAALLDQAAAAGVGPLEAMAALEALFARGLLDDDPPAGER